MRPTFLILAKCVPPLGFESGVPLAACPPRAVRSQRSTHSSMGPRPPGFQPMSQSLHTAQGTMVVAWPPASPAPSRCPRDSPAGAHSPSRFRRTRPRIRHTQLPARQGSGAPQAPLGWAPRSSHDFGTSLPTCPQGTHTDPPLPRWHRVPC